VKKKIISISAIIIVSVSISVFLSYDETKTNSQSNVKLGESEKTLENYHGRIVHITIGVEGKPITLSLPIDLALFQLDYVTDTQGNIKSATVKLRPELTDFYHQIGFFGKSENAVVVYPLFTQAAYDKNGFYDYYNKNCDLKCTTVNIPNKIDPRYETGGRAFVILNLLNYNYVTDVEVDKNPNILKKYDKVIILHNEYVTQKEFDAITSLPNVTYLYPNALYSKITADYTNNTITLIRGHGYPDPSIQNGFDWKFDNSRYEYDVTCDNWQFYKIDNGKMLNCYPSFKLFFDKSLLLELAQ
jgi:hypothetical protein